MKVTIYRPNRTKPRLFSTCDVARIAEECVLDEQGTAEEVLRCVHEALGYEYFTVKRPRKTLVNLFNQFVANARKYEEDIILKDPALAAGVTQALAVGKDLELILEAGAFARFLSGIAYWLFARIPAVLFSGLLLTYFEDGLSLLDRIVAELISEYDIVKVRKGDSAIALAAAAAGTLDKPPEDECQCLYLKQQRRKKRDEINDRKKTKTEGTGGRKRQRANPVKKVTRKIGTG